MTLFTFGFVFYWVLPIGVGDIATNLAGSSWSNLFGSGEFSRPYLLACLVIYISFAVGDMVAIRILRAVPGRPRRFSRIGFGICLAMGVPTLAYTAFAYRALLFREYQVDPAGDRARGAVSAFVVFLGVIALLYISDHAQERFRRLALSWCVLPFIVGCVFLLRLGSRLNVVSFVLIFVVYRSTFVRRIKLKVVLAGAITVAVLSGTIGVLRMHLTLADSGINVLLEPMLTSLSLLYFLRFDRIAWIHFPSYLISDLTNLIPTALFPGKAELIHFPFVFNPVGALNSFVSFNFNFGIIGTVVFMFLLPICLRWIRARSALQLPRVSYAMLSGFLAFTFFRDPFSVSLVKSMLQFSIIVPAVLVLFNRMIQSCGENVPQTSPKV